ncbi:M48 family metalloprotease [Agarivorans sp. TSD2052]|uniref:M48 family metalloprotease n=1 Tax=Agarivorans sp. TSD2052 TaxID=2937286 RepID=UPI00200BE608|nr:M48 family metalloprotease [Agarivorans sp. TSD2052]UPW18786.1 M48 family metalloprotease [Agarivorans sp. TSD2052]
MMNIFKFSPIVVLLAGCAATDVPNLSFGKSKYEQFDGPFLSTAAVQKVATSPLTTSDATGEKKSYLAGSPIIGKDIVYNEYLVNYFDSIVNKLMLGWPGEKPEVDLSIDMSLTYSAFSTQNQVVISMGVVSDSETEAEVAFVIAHELSHVLLRHNETNAFFMKQHETVEEISKLANFANAVGDMEVTKQSKNLKVVSKNSDNAARNYKDIFKTGLAINRLSRDVISSSMARNDEDEADLLAVDLLVKAGYNPRGYSTAMQRMESSEVFTQQQLDEKKADYQQVVTVLSESAIPSDQSFGRSLAYAAANNGITELLQMSSGRHREAEERHTDLASYIQREYRSSKMRSMHQQRYQEKVKSGEGLSITNNYWSAYNAQKALESGDIAQAEQLAKTSVKGPTSKHAYPRVVFSQVRKQQGKLDKAAQNLDLIENWEGLSLESSLYAVNTYQALNRYSDAEAVLLKTEQRLPEKSVLYPQWVSLYYQQNELDKLNQWLGKCRAVGDTDLEFRCNTAAKIPAVVPDETAQEGVSSIFNTMSSLVDEL